MATQTTNYGLIKPEKTNPILIDQINENMDKIDAALAQKITASPGMGLISDEEKQKLSELENYGSEIALNRSTLGYQRKNLLKQTGDSKTQNGVTFTVNKDGSVTVNGTATGSASLYLTEKIIVPAGEYILSGCPAGGSSNTYKLTCYNDSWTNAFCDYGNGVKISFSQDTVRIFTLSVSTGATVENLTFNPMLRYAKITDATYEPYKPSIEERLAALEAAVMGGGET